MGAHLELLVALAALSCCCSPPVCGAESCSGFRHLENGRTYFRYGGLLVIFKCHPGYKLHGYQSSRCMSGRWSREPPVCVASGCLSPGPLSHGTLSMDPEGSWVRFSCDKGYRLQGPSVLFCKGHMWNSTKPECRGVDMQESNLQAPSVSKNQQLFHQGSTESAPTHESLRVTVYLAPSHSQGIKEQHRKHPSIGVKGTASSSSSGSYSGVIPATEPVTLTPSPAPPGEKVLGSKVQGGLSASISVSLPSPDNVTPPGTTTGSSGPGEGLLVFPSWPAGEEELANKTRPDLLSSPPSSTSSPPLIVAPSPSSSSSPESLTPTTLPPSGPQWTEQTLLTDRASIRPPTGCSSPSVLDHGTFYYHSVETPAGPGGPGENKDHILYACDPGYKLAHGDTHSYCQQGGTWSGVAPECVDVDECVGGNHPCQQGCINTFGSFKCVCDDGYQLAQDHISCTDVDECLLPVAVTGCVFGCVNTPGSFYCLCPPGYSLLTADGDCQDIDECVSAQGLGPCKEQCHNSPGSYRCSCTYGHVLAGDGHSCLAVCPSGYRKQLATGSEFAPAAGLRQECVDINECLEEEVCEWQCVNLPGSHRCICPRGYTLHSDGAHCKDVNECSQRNGGCSHVCVNHRGGYKCACPDTHRLSPYSWKKCVLRN